jgi:hypothetical protein
MHDELTVEQSFQKLLENLNPTEIQLQRIRTTRETIDSALASDPGIHLCDGKQQSFLTGSYARKTIIRPIGDIDLYARVHYGWHAKDKPPRLILSLIASALRMRYPTNTSVRVDSPCVVVRFRDYTFEVVPAVCYSDNLDLYDIPASGSQSWMQCYPHVPDQWITSSNYANDKMFVPLIKILKQWNRNKSVGLKSFHLELLTERVFGAVTKIDSYPQGILEFMHNVSYWLWLNSGPFIQEPRNSSRYVDGYLYENHLLLRTVRNKINAALKTAQQAWDFYVKGRHRRAKTLWHNLFGSMFPLPQQEPATPLPLPPLFQPEMSLREALLAQSTPAAFGNPIRASTLLDMLSGSSSYQPNNALSGYARTLFLKSLLKSKDT